LAKHNVERENAYCQGASSPQVFIVEYQCFIGFVLWLELNSM
jgi:hypothetical protein